MNPPGWHSFIYRELYPCGLELTIGIEPMLTGLQPAAFPLGYVSIKNCLGFPFSRPGTALALFVGLPRQGDVFAP